MAIEQPTLEYITTTKLGEKGQLTVPEQFRDDVGLGTGARQLRSFALAMGSSSFREQQRSSSCASASVRSHGSGKMLQDVLADSFRRSSPDPV